MTGSDVHSAQMAAAEYAARQDDDVATSLVGASIGNVRVVGRWKPGKRWLYVIEVPGQTKNVRGYELVRVARSAAANGLPVVMPRQPWRTEPAEEGLAV